MLKIKQEAPKVTHIVDVKFKQEAPKITHTVGVKH